MELLKGHVTFTHSVSSEVTTSFLEITTTPIRAHIGKGGEREIHSDSAHIPTAMERMPRMPPECVRRNLITIGLEGGSRGGRSVFPRISNDISFPLSNRDASHLPLKATASLAWEETDATLLVKLALGECV